MPPWNVVVTEPLSGLFMLSPFLVDNRLCLLLLPNRWTSPGSRLSLPVLPITSLPYHSGPLEMVA